MLSQEDSYEHGKYNFSRAPYQREWHEAYSDPETRVLVLMVGSQKGKTQFLKNILGYHIHQDPLPMLMVQPTLELAEAFSKDRFDTMVRDTPVLRDLVAENKSRIGGNTILHKQFIGGNFTLAGSNSASSLAGRPKAIFLGDEVDRWALSAGGEGSPRKLAATRTMAFGNAKHVYTSSPTYENASEISSLFELTDKRFLFTPCPKCGSSEILIWENFRYDTQNIRGNDSVIEKSIRYVFKCGHDIGQEDKYQAVTDSAWEATAEPAYPGHVGFSAWSGTSLIYSWTDLINEALQSKKKPEDWQVFWNTKLNRLWQDKGESPEWESAMAKREFYPRRKVPIGGIVLVAAMDLQIDRGEVEIKAYGKNLENWSIDYRVITGNPSLPEFWKAIDDLMNEDFEYEAGGISKLHRLGIDTGDGYHHATIAYQYIRKWSQNPMYARVIALKGSSQRFAPLVNTPKLLDKFPDGTPMPGGLYLYSVGTDRAKSEIYQSIRQAKPKDGESIPFHRMHFTDYEPVPGNEYYFKQLCSETLKPIKSKEGRVRYRYELRPGVRNEVLDTNVYCRAVIASLSADIWTESNWDQWFDKFVIKTNQYQTPSQDIKKRRVIPKDKPKKKSAQVGRGFQWDD